MLNPNRHDPNFHLGGSQTVGRLTLSDRKSGLSPTTVPHPGICQSLHIRTCWVNVEWISSIHPNADELVVLRYYSYPFIPIVPVIRKPLYWVYNSLHNQSELCYRHFWCFTFGWHFWRILTNANEGDEYIGRGCSSSFLIHPTCPVIYATTP